jgi:hypothetical protein
MSVLPPRSRLKTTVLPIGREARREGHRARLFLQRAALQAAHVHQVMRGKPVS